MTDLFLNISKLKNNSITASPSHEGVIQLPRDRFNNKVAFLRQRYAELDLFQQQIGHTKAGLLHQPYTSNKRTTHIYRIIFGMFSLIFAILGVATMAIPMKFIVGFFSSFTVIKGVITSFCFLLSLASFTLTMTLRTEREVIFHCVRNAKKLLKTIYTRKKIRLGISFLNMFGSKAQQQAKALREKYEEAFDHISSKKEDAIHLVHRIVTAETLSLAEKEILLNQAVEELQEKLISITHSFRTAQKA